MDAVWLTWEEQRRNLSMSTALGIKYFKIDATGNRLRRYLLCGYRTIKLLRMERPRLIFAQNPSIMLSMIASIYGRLSRTPVIIDAHNAALFPFEGRWSWANRLALKILNLASAVIVSNDNLSRYASTALRRVTVLPDPIPELAATEPYSFPRGRFKVLFVCTWARDEPYQELIQAARLIDSNTVVYITGKSDGKERNINGGLPDNVALTGYVPDQVYVAMLRGCDVVVDLTTREDCLVCGVYEAIAVRKPLVVTDTETLRGYLSGGAVFCENTPHGVATAIRVAIDQRAKLSEELVGLTERRRKDWQCRKNELLRLVSEL